MIDAKGRSCPEPVIMIKDAMKSKENLYEMVVDTKVSVENVTRFAEHAGYKVTVEERDEDFYLKIAK